MSHLSSCKGIAIYTNGSDAFAEPCPGCGEEWINRIFHQSCKKMQQLPDNSIHCCVTSPPYLGLRAYNGEDGMIGLEGSIAEYLEKMVAVFREVRRVLRPDGVCFVNMGDSYNAGTSAKPQRGTGDVRAWTNGLRDRERINANGDGLKVKDQMLMPHRLALSLQDDGWWIRDTIIFSKTNPMPSSVADRCTPAFEYVFMLAKSARYFTDMDAVREPLAESSLQRILQPTFDKQGGGIKDYSNGVNPNRSTRKALENLRKRATTSENWEERKLRGAGEEGAFHPLGANCRNVWNLATEPFTLCRYGCECGWYAVTDAKVADRKDAPGKPDVKCPQCGAWLERDSHYATMATALARKCIQIGTSEGGCCSECGAPRRRVTDVAYENPGNRTTNGDRNVENRDFSPGYDARLERVATTTGFEPTCECDADTVPCTVLDPFFGVGTTMAAAFELGRNAVGYEISEKYIQIAECRPQIRQKREYDAALRGEVLPPVTVLPIIDAPLFASDEGEGAA